MGKNFCMRTYGTSCLICVSEKDLFYLFPMVLASVLSRINFINTVYIVTPVSSHVIRTLKDLDINNQRIQIVSDKELLTQHELQLCGWSRQQILKLRSHILTSDDILCIGADTIILQPITKEDVYDIDGKLVIHYREHTDNNNHAQFEKERCKRISNLLRLSSETLEGKTDFIFDVFLFNTTILRQLENYLTEAFGNNYTSVIFPSVINDYNDTCTIGEWTLYVLFATLVQGKEYVLKRGNDFVHQVHSQRDFDSYAYTGKAVHFVGKNFDVEQIRTNL